MKIIAKKGAGFLPQCQINKKIIDWISLTSFHYGGFLFHNLIFFLSLFLSIIYINNILLNYIKKYCRQKG